jgi:hypothetical protein
MAALRHEKEQPHEETSFADVRIAPLRGQNQEESVEDRIAALKNESVEDRMAALRHENEGPPAYPIGWNVPESIQQDTSHFVMPQKSPPAHYPLPDHMEEVAPYPIDLDYPMNDAYPVGDGETFAYPDVVGPYPVDDSDVLDTYTLDAATHTEPKMVFKADKEIVGLIPSNLQKRRANKKIRAVAPKERPTTTAVCKANNSKSESTKSKSVGDDYDDFMKEILSLK